jgi:hypothetical protein
MKLNLCSSNDKKFGGHFFYVFKRLYMDWTFFVIGIPLSVTIIVGMLLLAARGNKKFVLEQEQELRAARQMGGAARARIVDWRCAEVQRYRRQNLTTFKLLLEVFPLDLQPAFTAGVVWELEPAAVNALQRGAFLPVIFDRANLRRIFPDTPGAHYFQENQHAYLGIENDFQPEEIVAASVVWQQQALPQQMLHQPHLAAYAPAPNTIYRKRSQKTLFGLPLWEVAFNLIRKKKKRVRYVKQAKARAIIAIGDSATGVIAIGSFAKGLISVGNFSLGLLSFGGFSLGLLSGGVFGVGLIGIGIFGVGLFSIGLMGGGYASFGAMVLASYPYDRFYKSPEMTEIYELFKTLTGMSDSGLEHTFGYGFLAFCAFSFVFSVVLMFAQVIVVQLLEPNDNRLESPAA